MNRSVKKKYAAPSLESIAIDQEITLVMDSPPCAPIDCAPPASKTVTRKASKASTPFGGTSPDYSKVQ